MLTEGVTQDWLASTSSFLIKISQYHRRRRDSPVQVPISFSCHFFSVNGNDLIWVKTIEYSNGLTIAQRGGGHRTSILFEEINSSGDYLLHRPELLSSPNHLASNSFLR